MPPEISVVPQQCGFDTTQSNVVKPKTEINKDNNNHCQPHQTPNQYNTSRIFHHIKKNSSSFLPKISLRANKIRMEHNSVSHDPNTVTFTMEKNSSSSQMSGTTFTHQDHSYYQSYSFTCLRNNAINNMSDPNSICKNKNSNNINYDADDEIELISSDNSNNYPIFRKPTFSDRLYLKGILHRPVDIVFLLSALMSIIWTIIRMHLIELPYLVATRFKKNSLQHPASWTWGYSFCMAVSRASSSHIRTVGQLRMASAVIEQFVPIRMITLRNLAINPNIRVKIKLDELLKPERATLKEIRSRLGLKFSDDYYGKSVNPLHPSKQYFESFLLNESKSNLANLPEEIGDIGPDGVYELKGEWIEVIHKENDINNDNEKTPVSSSSSFTLFSGNSSRYRKHQSGQRGQNRTKKSDVVLLYFHGGGHCFCSPKFHRALVSRMLLKFGKGARAFVVDYRMAPEHPFPASIHDAYAAYLYLTQPDHPAIIATDHELKHRLQRYRLPIDPKNIVICGDSAGGNLATALSLYLRDYVQPSISPKLELPSTSVLLSIWADISTCLPSGSALHTYCFAPGPIGSSPFDRHEFDNFKLHNYAGLYLCGDKNTVPNERNSMGEDRRWEWYRHLAQHPLVSPLFCANLKGLGDTLLQTGTFDRLCDDTRLYAYKLGQANPDKRIRLELYRDMVHVHQFFEFLPLARKAVSEMVNFVKQVQREQENRSKHHNINDNDNDQQLKQPQQSSSSSVSTLASISSPPNNTPSSTEFRVYELDLSEHVRDEGYPFNILESCWETKRSEIRENIII